MPNVPFALSEDTIRRLREAVKESYGLKKGSLSRFVEDAVNAMIDRLETQRAPELFRAYAGEEALAEALNLEGLALKLREKGVEPRSVVIVSSNALPLVARAGFRARGL